MKWYAKKNIDVKLSNKRFWLVLLFSTACSFAIFQQCKSPQNVASVQFQPEAVPYKTLSEYGFFTGKLAALMPNEDVLPYELITPLFSDYAHKARFVWMPDSVQATVNTEGEVAFPDNTVLIKNFYYPADFQQPERNWDIVETRLLMKVNDEWQAYTYVWNDDHSDAQLNLIGDFQPVTWKDETGQRHAIEYVVPNKNQCKSCHNVDNDIRPIGPKVQNLNRPFAYADGEMNQLEKWASVGILAADQNVAFPTIAQWDDPQGGSLEDRALAYLDVNCGHCHRPKGPAHMSGLYLTADQTNQAKLGVCKTPVAAGKGSGGRKFGIAPGQPDSSILYYRMVADDPGVMMPEFGRVIPHEEGIELIREWIASLEGDCD